MAEILKKPLKTSENMHSEFFHRIPRLNSYSTIKYDSNGTKSSGYSPRTTFIIVFGVFRVSGTLGMSANIVWRVCWWLNVATSLPSFCPHHLHLPPQQCLDHGPKTERGEPNNNK